ncbi:MAG TPA: AbrB/MazE/SpoVT family DNA-binding domain-containing protein [archaeon]|nr:AbrB/MazE/SpoVT family DNA-binding domain-containing protein [archaeon]
MTSPARTRKIGGSLAATIPKEIVKGLQLREDELIEIEVKKIKKSYFGALKGIGPFTHEDRLDSHD